MGKYKFLNDWINDTLYYLYVNNKSPILKAFKLHG